MKTFLASILFVLFAAVGSAQNTLAGNLTVQQTVKLTGAVTPAALTANVNDYAPANFSTATVLRLSSDAARSITGLAGGAAGRTIYLVNVGQYPITFATESTSSTAVNRFAIGSADFELTVGNAMGLWYDSTSSRWRPISGLDIETSGGTGTVQSVSVATANGVSGTVASSTTNPVITLSLGAITPSSVAATGTITGSNLSGTNTGDMANASVLLKIGESAGLPTWDGGAWPGGGSSSGGGTGTVQSVSVVSANGISGSVANATTTPSITLSLGAITPTSVAATGTVTGSNLSGTNTGDQTSVTGNAGTATKLQTARTINGVSFDGSASVTVPAAAGTLTGTTLASNVVTSSLTSAAGGTFGSAAFTNSTAYDPAGSAAAITLSGLGGVPTTRTVNGQALSSNVVLTYTDVGAAPSSTVSFPGFGTTGTTAAVGNDSRLSDARPASDVYAWAKATTKPTYTASEVGATTVGANFFGLTNPSAITFPRINADNTVTALSASSFRTAIGAGTSSFDGAFSSLSGIPANSAGWLKNNGTGTLSYSTPTKSDVGLGNVANLDTTNPANIAQSATYRFVSDTEKSTWNGKQDALGFTAVPNTRQVNGHALSADVTVTKSDVGLGSVENTALSTWAGSANVTTLGTIATGTWNATAIADGKIASALTGKTYNGLTLTAAATGFTVAGGTTSKTLTVSDNATINQSVATTSRPRFASLNVGAGAGAFLDQGGDGAVYLSGGAYYVGYSSDYLFKPVATQAQGILSESGQISLWSNTGLTIGTNFSPTRRMVISTSGYVGIGTGTTTPSSRLEVVDSNVGLRISSNNGSYKRILLFDNAASPTVKTWQIASQEISNGLHIGPSTTNGGTTFDQTGLFITGTGNMGIGTNIPQRTLHLYTATGPNFRLETSGSNAALELVPGNGSGSIYNWVLGAQYNYGNEFEITPSSSTGGLTFPSSGTVFRAAQSGTIRFPKYGAGTLVTDSSGNITASSDARLKNVTGSFTRGLDAIIQLSPRVYTWRAESGMNSYDVNVGFIAQEVQPFIPEAVGSVKTRDVEETDSKTGKKTKTTKRETAEFLSLSDRPIIAALVNAVKELKAENDDLRARLEKLEGKK